jgi:hypothetical protein
VWKDAAAAIAAPCLHKEQRTHADMGCTKHPRQQKETHQNQNSFGFSLSKQKKLELNPMMNRFSSLKCGCVE